MPKKEGDRHKLHKGTPAHEAAIKHVLVSGESVAYHANDIYITNLRIIQYRIDVLARLFHYFYNTFADLDLRHLESIKAKNIINLQLLFWGSFIILLGPIAALISLLPTIGGIGDFILDYIVTPLGLPGVLLLGVLLIVAAVILRDRVIEFYGQGPVIRVSHFDDEELVKIREIQRLRHLQT